MIAFIFILLTVAFVVSFILAINVAKSCDRQEAYLRALIEKNKRI